jgi:hypothetical protein
VSYRPVLPGRALEQFSDFINDHEQAYEAFMRRVLWLIDAPWDAVHASMARNLAIYRRTGGVRYGRLIDLLGGGVRCGRRDNASAAEAVHDVGSRRYRNRWQRVHRRSAR